MIDLLAATLVMGAQSVFLTEIVYSLVNRWLPQRFVNSVFPVVFSAWTAYFFDYGIKEQYLLIPASSFVALAIFKWLYSPVVMPQGTGRYR